MPDIVPVLSQRFPHQVLITKLRSANTVETRQYRKAAKALLVLIPLFGITYLVVLAGPSESGLMGHMFAVLRAVLLSTQASFRLCFCLLCQQIFTLTLDRAFGCRSSTASSTRRCAMRCDIMFPPGAIRATFNATRTEGGRHFQIVIHT